MPISIAGMHRSGTSLVAHLLQMCGLYLGEACDLVPAAEANPDGYFEHRRFVEINDQLLKTLGGDWATPAAIPESSSVLWTENADLRRLKKAADQLCRDFAGHGTWGWKDPRNSITLPFWSSLIQDLKIVVCVRHPLEVAASLSRIDPNASIASGVERWMTYYQRLLADAPVNARMLSHAGSFFCEPKTEIRRVAEFAGVAPGDDVLERCIGIIRPDLRRNRFTGDDVAGFDLPVDALDLYARMCDEAGWSEGRARAASSLRAPDGAVAVEEFERLFAARSVHTRRLAAVDAMFVDQQEDFDRREDDLLRAMQAGGTVRGTAREYRRLVEYRRMVKIVRRVLRYVVPPNRVMLVMGRGDEELQVGPNARVFPQGPDGQYAGYHPATSLNAIGHLEALRAAGADFLVVPKTELWWFDHFRDFGRHVRNRYRAVLEDPWSCSVFALHDDAPRKTIADSFRETMTACEETLQRQPAVLDWGTGARLASEFPDRTVFAPPDEASVLPYLDRSVDVVAISAAAPERIAEAERVAGSAVVVFPGATDSSRQLGVRWTERSVSWLPMVSLILSPSHQRPAGSPMLRAIAETLPGWLDVELLVGHQVVLPPELLSGASGSGEHIRISRVAENGSFGRFCNVAAARAEGEILIFLDPCAVVLPDWLAPLLRLFRDRPRAGAAGGKVLERDGRLEHGGGVIAADGTLRSIAEEAYASAGPASEVVRQVDWCSPVLLATRRSVFTDVGGFDEACSSPMYEAGDYCLRLRKRGHDVLFQPDTAAVRVEAAAPAGDPPAAFVQRWSR